MILTISYIPGGETELQSDTWKALSRIALLCNRATFLPGQKDIPVLKRETAGFYVIKSLLYLQHYLRK